MEPMGEGDLRGEAPPKKKIAGFYSNFSVLLNSSRKYFQNEDDCLFSKKEYTYHIFVFQTKWDRLWDFQNLKNGTGAIIHTLYGQQLKKFDF